LESSSRQSTYGIDQLRNYELRGLLSRPELKSHLTAFSLMTSVSLIYLLFQGTYGLELFGSYGLIAFMSAAAILGIISYMRLGKSLFSSISLGIAVGLISWVLGLAVYTYTYYIANADLPYVSIADLFYLMSYPPMIWGALGLLRLFGRSLDRVEWTIVAVSGAALCLLMIPYVIVPSIEGLTALEALVTIVYPLMDTVVFLLILPLVFAFRKGVFGFSFAMIASGTALYALGDVALAYVNVTTGYYDGHPLDLLLFLGSILVGYGFWKRNSDLKYIDFGKRMNNKFIKLDLGTHCVYCNLEVRDKDVCQVCKRISKKLFQTNYLCLAVET
jgi:hypothetical protein